MPLEKDSALVVNGVPEREKEAGGDQGGPGPVFFRGWPGGSGMRPGGWRVWRKPAQNADFRE